jgi:hypothetical protein
MNPAITISVSIQRAVGDVYAFAADPANLPQWAPGLCRSIVPLGDVWIAESPNGPVTVRFIEHNAFGVLDHKVLLPSGDEVFVPMRVVENGEGSELLFTLFRSERMSDEEADADVGAVRADLIRLKTILEAGRSGDAPPPERS